MSGENVNLLKLAPGEMADFLGKMGEAPYRGRQILKWIYRKGVISFADMTDLGLPLRCQLSRLAVISTMKLAAKQVSCDQTEKYLFVLADSQSIETVLLPYDIGFSVCISTQVGCRMGCCFCASGLPGLVRNLSAAEMMEQVLYIKRQLFLRGNDLKSLVLMGSGEPLDNFREVKAFLEAVRDPERLGFSLRHVTVSTAGLAPKIGELAQLRLPVTLAVSLHAPNNELRSRIMPVNTAYPLETLLPACDHYTALTGRRVTYEYILIDGYNDRDEHACQLALLLKERICHINLIPHNTVPELGLVPSPASRVSRFAGYLRGKGLNVTVRRQLGEDIAAACGQLRNNLLKNSQLNGNFHKG